jgi:hypothetical protein
MAAEQQGMYNLQHLYNAIYELYYQECIDRKRRKNYTC